MDGSGKVSAGIQTPEGHSKGSTRELRYNNEHSGTLKTLCIFSPLTILTLFLAGSCRADLLGVDFVACLVGWDFRMMV